MRKITMIDDYVRIERTTVEREVKAADFIKEIIRSEPADSGILPYGCVRRVSNNTRAGMGGEDIRMLYILQVPPHINSMQFKRAPKTEEEEQFPDKCIEEKRCSWPNTLWFVAFAGKVLQTLHFAATTTPYIINGDKTPLLYLPTPNQYEQGHVCTGTLSLDQNIPEQVRVERVMEYMSKSLWNTDLMPNYNNHDYGIKSIDDWAKKTEKDPDFWRKLTMPNHKLGRTVGAAIERLIGRSINA